VSSTDEGGAAFHAQWDGAFVHPIREALKASNDDERSLEAVATAILKTYNDDAFERVIYTESHDEVANGKARVPLEVAPDDTSGELAQKLATMGAAMLLTAPGIPMLFMGQEFLQDGWFQDTVPLDWSLAEEQSGVLQIWRDLISLRRNASGRSAGLRGQHTQLVHADDAANVIAYHRWADGGPGDSVFVVVNLSGEARTDLPIQFPAAGGWELLMNTDGTSYSEEYGSVESTSVTADGDPASASVNVGPYSALIYGFTG
jgi:1,4-alpha-glucan branching enzyme